MRVSLGRLTLTPYTQRFWLFSATKLPEFPGGLDRR
jgi:hypothetical protein